MDYQAALGIIHQNQNKFQDKSAHWLYWKLCFTCLLGQKEKALLVLDQALDSGIWWSPHTLSSESDLEIIRNEDAFLKASEAMAKLYESARSTAKPILLRVGKDTAAYRILNLHWRDDNIEIYARFFYPLDQDLQMLLIQSSQPASSRGFCWDDHSIGRSDIEACLGSEMEKVDLILGSSQGGSLAFRLACERHWPYLGVMPAMGDLNLIKSCFWPEGKYRLLIGSQDRFYSTSQQVDLMIRNSGGNSRLITMGDAGHFFPPDLMNYIKPLIQESLT